MNPTRREVLKTMAAAPVVGMTALQASPSVLDRLRGKAWTLTGGGWKDVADVLDLTRLKSVGEGFSQFLGSVARLQAPRSAYKNKIVEGSGYTGGYLTTPQHSKKLKDLAANESILRRLCKSVEMNARTYHDSVLEDSWSGQQCYRDVELVARDLVGLFCTVPELSDDPELLDLIFTSLTSNSVGWMYDWYGLNGNGYNQPLGVTNSAALIEVERRDGFLELVPYP